MILMEWVLCTGHCMLRSNIIYSILTLQNNANECRKIHTNLTGLAVKIIAATC